MSDLKTNASMTNWKWRGVRLLGVLGGSLLVTIAAAEKASGEPIGWAGFPELLGPAVVVGLIVQAVAAVLTGTPNGKGK